MKDAPRDARVVVVGAGLAGLIAALRLERAGVRVTVLESAAQVGGRRASAELDGVAYDPEPVTLPASTPHLDRALADLDLRSSLEFEPFEHATLAWRGRLRPLHLRRIARLAPAPGMPPWELRRLAKLRALADWFGEKLEADAPEACTRLDDRSVADFARLYLGRRVHERLLRPLLDVHFGLDTESTTRIQLMLLANGRGSPDLKLAAGVGSLAPAIAARLREVRTGVGARNVRADGLGVGTRAGERIEADAVVLAVPPSEVRALVPSLSPFEELFYRRASGIDAERLGLASAPSERLVLAVRTRTWVDLGSPALWIPADVRGHLAGIVRPPGAARGQLSGQPLLLVGRPGLTRLDDRSDERSTAEALLRAAAAHLPGFRTQVEAVRLHRKPRLGASFDVGSVRAVARLREEQTSQAKLRPIFYCGDYLIGPHAEAAIAAGDRTAEDVTRVLRS